MTDDQLAAFVPALVRWEGSVPWMYRDVLGYVTTAIGYLVHDATEAAKLPFQVDGRPATAKEIGDDFLRVIALGRGMPAHAYRAYGPPHVELSDAAITALAIGRLRHEFIPGLQRLCPGFDGFPAPAQSALVDMAWNLGVRGLEKFGQVLAAVDRRVWRAAAEHCHRRTSRDERNAWCRAQFLAAAGSPPG